MLGYAIGCIGMGYDDFCRLTVAEFESIANTYNERQEALQRAEWERMRMLATISIQPHTRQKITPEKLLPFSWEKRKAQTKTVSREESLRRFEALVKKDR